MFNKEKIRQRALLAIEANKQGKILRGNSLVKPKESNLSYSDLRAQEYPSIQEQLAMLYWDKVNGTDDWFNEIKRIKEKYPKSSEE